jgi:hypothetical protein
MAHLTVFLSIIAIIAINVALLLKMAVRYNEYSFNSELRKKPNHFGRVSEKLINIIKELILGRQGICQSLEGKTKTHSGTLRSLDNCLGTTLQ